MLVQLESEEQLSTPNTPVRPNDIRLDPVIMSSFKSLEAGVAAHRVVAYCQDRKGNNWRPFTVSEFQPYSLQRWCQETPLGDLERQGFITFANRQINLTVKFVATCYGVAYWE